MRRFSFIVIALILIPLLLLVLAWYEALAQNFFQVHFYSGWTLFSVLVLLSIYNIRKKFSFLPLTKVVFWRHTHIALGLIVIILYITHAGVKLPDSNLLRLVFIIFNLIILMGFIGFYLSKIIPQRLVRFEQLYLLENLPKAREMVQNNLELKLLQLIKDSQSKTISHFYQQWLRDYCLSFKNPFYHFFNTRIPYNQVRDKFEALHPYINTKEQKALEELILIVFNKTDLDNQYYNLLLLKYWPFLHIALAYVLIAITLLHATIVHAYIGGLFT